MNIAGYDALARTPAGEKHLGFTIDEDEVSFEQAAAWRIAQAAEKFGSPIEIVGVWERQPYDVFELRYAFPQGTPPEVIDLLNKELAAVIRTRDEATRESGTEAVPVLIPVTARPGQEASQ